MKYILWAILLTLCLCACAAGCTAVMSVYLQSHPSENVSSAEEIRELNRHPQVDLLKETEFFQGLSRWDQSAAVRITRILNRTIAPEAIRFYLNFRNRDLYPTAEGRSWEELIPVFQKEFVEAGVFDAQDAQLLLEHYPQF